jgi:CubicO group peptidase (beta-lactamase class C family)
MSQSAGEYLRGEVDTVIAPIIDALLQTRPKGTADIRQAIADKVADTSATQSTLFRSDVKYSPFTPAGNVTGTVAPGWEGVREAFALNFAEGLEQGSQLCVYHEGKLCVDLCGVHPDTQMHHGTYDRNALQCVWSSGKNAEVITMAILADRGLLSYDDPIAKHWPEFAQAGKEKITVADLMRHSAGMAYFVKPGTEGTDSEEYLLLSLEDVQKRDPMHDLMAKCPAQKVGDDNCTYHAMTRGFVVDGILKRVDPKGRTIGQFFKDEVLTPLGLNQGYHITMTEAEASSMNVAKNYQYPPMYSVHMDFGPAMMGMGDPQIAILMKALGDPTNPSVKARCVIDDRSSVECSIDDRSSVECSIDDRSSVECSIDDRSSV